LLLVLQIFSQRPGACHGNERTPEEDDANKLHCFRLNLIMGRAEAVWAWSRLSTVYWLCATVL